MKQVFELELYGKTMSFETGRVAKQANCAFLARHGDTVVLVTTVMSEKPREGMDFFPLLVDFEERYYAAGKVPGGFITLGLLLILVNALSNKSKKKGAAA